jgi:hypothetical protein
MYFDKICFFQKYLAPQNCLKSEYIYCKPNQSTFYRPFYSSIFKKDLNFKNLRDLFQKKSKKYFSDHFLK